MLHYPHRPRSHSMRVLVIAITFALILPATAAHAQSDVDTVQPLDPRPVRELTTEEVVSMVISSNPSLNVGRVGLEQARRNRQGADQFAPWVLDADATYSHRDQPIRDSFSEGLQIIDNFDWSVGVGTAWSYGTELAVRFVNSIRRSEVPLIVQLGAGERRVTGPFATAALTVSATQHLLRGGDHTYNTLREQAASREVSSATLSLEKTASDRVMEALDAYWELRKSHSSVELSERAIELLDQQDEVTRQLIEAGKIAEIELDVIAQRRLNAEEAVLLAVLAREQQELELRRTTGLEMPGAERLLPIETDTVIFYDIEDAEALVTMAQERSYAVRLLEERLESSALEVTRTGEPLRPELDLTIAISQQGLDDAVGIDDGLFFDAWKQVALLEFGAISASLVFRMNLDDQRAHADYDAATIEQMQIEAELEETRAVIETNVLKLVTTSQRYRARLDLGERAVVLATTNLANGNDRFIAGQITTLDLLTLQEALDDAQQQLLTARIEAIKVHLQVLNATGQLLDTYGVGAQDLESTTPN